MVPDFCRPTAQQSADETQVTPTNVLIREPLSDGTIVQFPGVETLGSRAAARPTSAPIKQRARPASLRGLTKCGIAISTLCTATGSSSDSVSDSKMAVCSKFVDGIAVKTSSELLMQ